MRKRDWKQINEALVRRGELLLDLDFVKGWENELEGMNKGKEGAPFRYPDSFIHFLLFMYVYLHLPYRQLEGGTKALARYVKGLKVPDHSSIQWRAEKLPVKLDKTRIDSNESLNIALDGSGIKVFNRGEWIRHKWKVKRGYLKIHIAVDVKRKKILALKVTDERVGDGRMLQPLVEEASKKAKIAKTVADGAYDAKSNFRYLDDRGIEPVIKVRKNASSRAGGCIPRKLVAQEYLRDPEAWKRKHGYGQRWMVESTISSLKRTF